MATWSLITGLPDQFKNRILNSYNCNNFLPLEVRMHFADWIEKQNWLHSFDESFYYQNSALSYEHSQLIKQFCELINQKLSQITDVTLKYKFEKYLFLLQTHNSADIVRQIQDCLQQEQSIIAFYQNMNQTVINTFYTLNEQCKSNMNKIKELESTVRSFKSIKEELNLKDQQIFLLNKEIQRSQKMVPQVKLSPEQLAEKEKLNEDKNKLLRIYENACNRLLTEHQKIIQEMKTIYENLILQELKNNPKCLSENYLQIKDVCEMFASNIGQMLQQLTNVVAIVAENENGVYVSQFQNLKLAVISLLKSFFNETFIIKTQPKQVIKKETKFTATVSVLVSRMLNISINPPVVKVFIINEHQAKQYHSEKEEYQVCTSGDIVNNTSVMEYNATTNDLSAEFGNMQLKKIKRTEKRGSESVMDEKFGLLFCTEIYIERDIVFKLKTLSVPVAVIVHGNQEANAQSTIIWDNAFSHPSRCPFDVPNEVKFGQLADVLSLKFHEAGGRHLTEDHKRFLAEKIVGKDVPDPLNVMVSWFKFSKEHLEGKTFTFWEWFYAILKLTKDHLSELWRDDLVIGFVTRQRAEELLSNQQQGSFLIRFSDTSLGVISIALKNAQDKCLMVGPLSAKELKISKIADSIRDLEQLQFLYPGIPKNEAFSKYYTRESPQNSASNGYVRPLLRPYIPGENLNENSDIRSSFTEVFSDQSTSNLQVDDLGAYMDFDLKYPMDTTTYSDDYTFNDY